MYFRIYEHLKYNSFLNGYVNCRSRGDSSIPFDFLNIMIVSNLLYRKFNYFTQFTANVRVSPSPSEFQWYPFYYSSLRNDSIWNHMWECELWRTSTCTSPFMYAARVISDAHVFPVWNLIGNPLYFYRVTKKWFVRIVGQRRKVGQFGKLSISFFYKTSFFNEKTLLEHRNICDITEFDCDI